MAVLGALALSLALLFVAANAPAAPRLALDAAPLLGSSTAFGPGWTSVGVRLASGEKTALEGQVRVRTKSAWGTSQGRIVTETAFALAPGARVALELPTHGFANTAAELEISVVDRNGALLAKQELSAPSTQSPLVFDLLAPSRLAPALRGHGIATQRGGGGYRTPPVVVSTPLTDPASGDVILPRWAAAYGSASLVVASGRSLSALAAPQQKALSDWVLSGGALALALDRPEDLRQAAILAMAGGPIARAEPAPEWFEPATFFLVTDPNAAGPRDPQQQAYLPAERRAPGSLTQTLLKGYSGSNLRTTPWGSAASYGLGELHLLAFDPSEAVLSDRWAQLKLVDLLRHAWERRRTIALPLGQTAFDAYEASEVRAVLDPNRSMRWTIVIAALMLLAYATLAGPLNFWLAARRGRPLRALLYLPIWASGALAFIVLLGLFGKGVRGQAHELGLVEAGAGMERGAATRFRGLYAPSSREIRVEPSSRSSLLDVSSPDDWIERTLTVDREGARLDPLRTKPWATVVVREDGFASLAGGISIVPIAEGGVTIKNRSARALVGAILKTPGKPAVIFDRIEDGATASSSGPEAKPLPTPLGTPIYSPTVHPLGAALFAETLDTTMDGLGRAWQAIEALAGQGVDFWPDDVPVLIGALEGGERRSRDSGLAVKSDRLLVRVVGYGGVP